MMQARAPGFTLIEVLIALAITALIATLSFSSLTAVLDSVEQVRETRARITEMNRFWAMLSRDLEAVVNRPVRNEYGDRESAFWGGAETADYSLNFTRIGWRNPNNRDRSDMQRVRYVWEEETLWRESFPVLDRTSETEPQRIALLDNVLNFELAFLSETADVSLDELDTDDWAEDWDIGTDGGSSPPPRAVEIRLELEDWGEIRRLYELPQREVGGG